MARILIVDDNQTMAEMLSMALECYGHRTLVALGGRQALEVIASARADVVLLDLMMPDIDGFETLHRLRATPYGQELPVIVVTAREEENLNQKVALAGGNGLLRKPVDLHMLTELIADLVVHHANNV